MGFVLFTVVFISYALYMILNMYCVCIVYLCYV